MPAPLPVTRSQAFLEALGTDTDAAIAVLFDVSKATVSYHRLKRGIERAGHQRAETVDKLLLDGMSNAAVCRATGMTRKGVRMRRAALGVPPSTAGGRPISRRFGPEADHRRVIEARSRAKRKAKAKAK